MRNTLIIAVLISVDMVLCSGLALQLLCIALAALCLLMACYIGYKQSSGVWLNRQQYEALHDLVKNEILKDKI